MKPGEMTAEERLGLARKQLDDEYNAALAEYNRRDLHAGIFTSRRQWFADRAIHERAELLARLNAGGAPQTRKPLPLKDQVDIAKHNGARWIQVAIAELEPLLEGASQPLQASTLVEAWRTLQNQIAGILAGHPVRCFDETMSAMDSAVKFFSAPPAQKDADISQLSPAQAYLRGLDDARAQAKYAAEHAPQASPQLEQTLRVGMAAGQLCRILNVQDRQGWHWDRFVEILTQCFPPVESPQHEQVAREIGHKYGHHASRVPTFEGLMEILQRHFPGSEGAANSSALSGIGIPHGEGAASPSVAAVDCTCKKPDFQHAICPVHDTASLTPRKEPLGMCDSRWHVSRPHPQHLGCINFRPSHEEKGAKE